MDLISHEYVDVEEVQEKEVDQENEGERENLLPRNRRSSRNQIDEEGHDIHQPGRNPEG